MENEFFPQLTPDSTLLSPDEQTQGEILDKEKFHDVYKLVEEDGLPYFARLNGRGEVELYLVFETVDAFSEQTRDAVSVEFKTYQNKLLAVIWTLTDPLQPLGFPLSFDIRSADERFVALTILQQPFTALHYLAYEDGQMTHIYSEAIHFSEDERIRANGMIRSLYDGTPESMPEEAEVREEDTQTISALSLPASVLEETGMAFVLEYNRMMATHGEEEAQHLLMSTVKQAVWVMRRHSRSEVRDSSFTVWAAEQAERLSLIVTPSLSHLFEVVHMSEDEANPFSRFLMTLPEFVQTEDAAPLQLGAFPLLRYENGQLYHLELDEVVQQHLAKLFTQAFPGILNPYM
ncbi:hypothetical protein [Brevibacillus reuszeri]|uniref:hypothetical protein n=1 Tax=Brevibacillus reuszeri TaxID=54915 RepID=UPI002898F390|nr:hypothetical protein [Brevibacillus reuszeri]